MRFAPKVSPTGVNLQAGIPFGPPASTSGGGLLLRGVVIATYVYDDPDHPFAAAQPAAMYCDVLIYTQMTGGRAYVLRGALVSQELSSIQGGVIHKPRAATQTISGGTLDPTKPIDPTQLDGDHVLVGFIDEKRTQPVILRAIPPPNQDIGHADDTLGHRARLVLADGDPLIWKNCGSWLGMDGSGNITLDASQANQGQIGPDGREVPSSGGGAVRQRAKLAAGASVELVDPASGQSVVVQSLAAGGLTVDYGSRPASITVKGSQGNALAIPSPGVAAVQLGAGGATLVSTNLLNGWLQTVLLPYLTSNFVPSKIPPAPMPSAPVGNTNVRVPE